MCLTFLSSQLVCVSMCAFVFFCVCSCNCLLLYYVYMDIHVSAMVSEREKDKGDYRKLCVISWRGRLFFAPEASYMLKEVL